MSNKSILKLAKQIANLDSASQVQISHASDDDLPEVFRRLGLELPSSNWWLRVLKVILYGLGIILAGFGTANAATVVSPLIGM